MKKLSVVFLLLLLATLLKSQIVLNPKNFGLSSDNTGIDNYNILYECHKRAKEIGANISYSGIDSVLLDIPLNATPIPLTNQVDFTGVILKVRNNSKSHWLFDMVNPSRPSSLIWQDIEKGDVNGIKNALLIVKDEEPWVKERKGYGAGHTRMDLLYIKGGKIQNNTIYPYNSSLSKPVVYISEVDNKKKNIRNISIIRDEESKFITRCFRIVNQNNVTLSNISLITPESSLSGDGAIMIENCSNVTMDNIKIDGTYSQYNKYGYGISLYNVWNVVCKHIRADGKWGIFGNFNVNRILLDNCDINRFDIHCYGKDVTMKKCIIRRLYNQISSVFGKVVFDSCIFDQAIPLLIESSYNAYTPFDVEWNNCIFYLDKKHNYLLTLFGVPDDMNERFELANKCLPNISVINSNVYLDNIVEQWYLIDTGGLRFRGVFDNISNITMKGVKVHGSPKLKFELATEKLIYTNSVNINIKMKYVE